MVGVNWWMYVTRVSEGALQKEIAARAGVEQSTVSRWKRGGSVPDPVPVAAFARAYHRPVLEAFIAAGFLTAKEAGERPLALPLSPLTSLTDDELLDEVRRRMNQRGSSVRPTEVGESSTNAVPGSGTTPRPDLVWPDPQAPAIAARHGQSAQHDSGHAMDPAGEDDQDRGQ